MKYIILAMTISISSFCFAATDKKETQSKIENIEQIENSIDEELPVPDLNREEEVEEATQVELLDQNQKANFEDLKKINSNKIGLTESQMAAVQKTYMPKSGRAQLGAMMTLNMTDPFYRNVGLNLNLTYHFTEMWGVESFYQANTSIQREELKSLNNTQNVNIQNLVSIKNLYGLNLVINSIYGKLSLTNNKIFPFEIYQKVGVLKATNQNESEGTGYSIGIGELISVSRSQAVKIDLNWSFYNTKNILSQNVTDDSIYLAFGYCWFFPNPRYR